MPGGAVVHMTVPWSILFLRARVVQAWPCASLRVHAPDGRGHLDFTVALKQLSGSHTN